MDTTITNLPTASGVDPSSDWLVIDRTSLDTTQKINRNTLLNITGAPVGTTDTQTLTNKTLTAPTISSPVLSGTITGTYTLGGTPTFPASIVTLTGTQTLTNKTLTSPVITGGSITGSTVTVDAIAGQTSPTSGTIYGVGVTAARINGSSLTNASVGTTQLADASVTTPKLADGAVTPLKRSGGFYSIAWDASSLGTGNQNITNIGFTPKAMQVVGSQRTSATEAYNSQGFCYYNGSTYPQFGSSSYVANASFQTLSNATNAVVVRVGGTTTLLGAVTAFTSASNGTATINLGTNTGSSANNIILVFFG